MFKKLAVAAVAVAGFGIQAASAGDYTFTYTNDLQGPGDVAGTVTGLITGLSASGTSSATGLYITSFPSALLPFPGLTPTTNLAVPGALGSGTNVVVDNSFTVTNGNITNASYISYEFGLYQTNLNDPGNLVTQFGVYGLNELLNWTQNPITFTGDLAGLNDNGIQFTPVSSAPVPLPGSLTLMLGGLVGLMAIRRRQPTA